MGSKRVVIFAPHPDDETLGCGGSIAKKVHEGYEVFIVLMTDGRNHFLKVHGIASNPTPEEYGIVRGNEAKAAAKVLGVNDRNLFFLDYEDGKLSESEQMAQKKVARLLEEISPTEIYFPRKGDHHPDHRTTNRIVQNSVGELRFKPVGYQYVIHRKFGRLNPVMEKIVNRFNRKTVYVDISTFLHLKEMAMNEYKSQVTIISEKQRRPALDSLFLARFLKNKETFFTQKKQSNPKSS